MPIIKSAIKRVRQTKTRNRRNAIVKTEYKKLIKDFLKVLETSKDEAAKLFPQVQKAIDTAVKKNLLHANTAARKKSSLAKKLSVEPSKSPASAAPKAAKKPATKKPAAKKKK